MKQIGTIITEIRHKTSEIRLQNTQEPSWVAEIKTKFGDSERFLISFNPDKQADYVANYFRRCFVGEAPELARVKITYGENICKLWLTVQLTELNSFCGMKSNPDISQINSLASVIMTNYYFLKVTEIMVFLQKFKAGNYGSFYGTFDPIIITTALKKFIEERSYLIDKFKNEIE